MYFSPKQDLYVGRYDLNPLFTSVFSEHYELHLCLPENAELVEIELRIPVVSEEVYRDHGVLEYFGKTCHKYVFQNIWPAMYDNDFKFTFKYNK